MPHTVTKKEQLGRSLVRVPLKTVQDQMRCPRAPSWSVCCQMTDQLTPVNEVSLRDQKVSEMCDICPHVSLPRSHVAALGSKLITLCESWFS